MACNPLPFVFPLGNLSSEETEASLMLPAPIGRIEHSPSECKIGNYEQNRYHLFSLSNRPRINETSETSVFNLL